LACVLIVAAGAAANGQEQVPASGSNVEVALTPKVRIPLETRVVTGAPYSAEVVTESIETLADGNRIVHRTTGRVYRDGEGRVRREEDRGAGQAPGVSITDPVARLSYSCDPENKIVFKTQGTGPTTFVYSTGEAAGTMILKSDVDPADVERRRQVESHITTSAHAMGGDVFEMRIDQAMAMKIAKGAPAWDEKVEKLPARQIEGVQAEGTRITRTIPAAAIGNERPIVIVTEEWRSPELQALLSTTTSDPRTGETTHKLTNVVRGEPGASWFEPPAGYTVRDTGIAHKNVIIRRDKDEK
jgi:hypothetical protein